MNSKGRSFGKALVGLLGLIAAVGAQNQAYAMWSSVKSENRSSKEVEAVPGEYVVQMRKSGGASLLSLRTLMSERGFKVTESVNRKEDVYRVKMIDAQLAAKSLGLSMKALSGGHGDVVSALATLPGVELVEPNFIYRLLDVPQSQPNDPQFSNLWAMRNVGQNDSSGRAGKVGADIKATQAWTLEKGSKNVVVAVIDTGIDYTHPDLKDNVWSKPGSPDIHGFNAITGVENPMDDHNHGTHCSGTIGGVGDNGVGVTGINWSVSIMGSKFLSASGGGNLADAIKAIDYATDHGAQVMSNSWGGGGFSQTLMDAIARANAKGIIFIAAAGNDGSDNDATPSYPASYDLPNVVAVAASNNVDGMSYFSNYGKTKVLLMAPGENIVSSVIGNKYDSYSGTSMATPHVAGAVALLLAHEPSLTIAQIKERLGRTSDKLKAFSKKLSSAGRLNLYNLLADITPPGIITIPDSAWRALLPKVVATVHPYAASTKTSWTIEHPGAKFIRIHFSKFDLESGYDKLVLKTAAGDEADSLTGHLVDNTWSAEVEGDKAVLEFTSDNSVQNYGFDIDGYSWTDFAGQVQDVAISH